MGTTFVQIDDKGFWMQDNILELWLRLLALHIPEPKESVELNYSIRNKWFLASKGYFTGFVPDCLADIVSTVEGKDIVIQAIDSVITTLEKLPGKLDKKFLNLLGFEYAFPEDIDVDRLLEVGHAFKMLIAGKITATADSTNFMPGSKKR